MASTVRLEKVSSWASEATQKNYGNQINPYLMDLILKGQNRVLDIGCAQGALLEALKNNGQAEETVGVEITQSCAELAESKVDRVIFGDVECLDLSQYAGYFDYIVYGDILEHLREPWAAVHKHKRLLRDSGRMIFCLPNVRNFFILTNLIRGFWNYTRYGILDHTHLRFYTLRNIRRHFEELGLFVEKHFGITPSSAWYKRTNQDVGFDQQLLDIHDKIIEKHQNCEDCSRELAMVFGKFRFSAADVSELIAAQFVFRVAIG